MEEFVNKWKEIMSSGLCLNLKYNIPIDITTCVMPRKSTGEKLEKVVSTKISAKHSVILQKYARGYYNLNWLEQPNLSQMLRWIIKNWTEDTTDSMRQVTNTVRQKEPKQ